MHVTRDFDEVVDEPSLFMISRTKGVLAVSSRRPCRRTGEVLLLLAEAEEAVLQWVTVTHCPAGRGPAAGLTCPASTTAWNVTGRPTPRPPHRPLYFVRCQPSRFKLLQCCTCVVLG